MVDIPETNHYCVTKQPNTAEETDQVYGSTPKSIELISGINSTTDIICGDLLRCLCYCCFVTDNKTDSNCCSDRCCDCHCDGCDNCDCGGCDNCDCGGCNGCDC